MTLEIMGTPVDVRTAGEKGAGLLLLHGWMCSAEMMAGVQNAFSGTMRTVAVDFPGHGKIGKAMPPPEPWGVPEYAEMAAQVIKQLELAPCSIIAHSFGARVALYLAADKPEMVGKLVLTGAAGIRKPQTRQYKRRASLYRRLRATLDFAENYGLFGGFPARLKENLVQRFASEDYRVLTPEMRRTFNKVVTEDLTPLLGKVSAPTLLYWGSDDSETPLWMGKLMEERIPDAGLVVEEGAGHFAWLEHLDKFLLIVSNFLDEPLDFSGLTGCLNGF